MQLKYRTQMTANLAKIKDTQLSHFNRVNHQYHIVRLDDIAQLF